VNPSFIKPKNIPLLATFTVLFTLLVVASVLYDNFLSPLNFANILRNNAFLGVIAIGMTFVIVSGGIDLSVGTVMGFSTILLARLISVDLVPPLLAVLVVLIVGIAFGALMGGIIHSYTLPAFLVTLSGMFLAKGLAFVVLPQSQKIDHETFSAVARFKWKVFGNAPITLSTLIFMLVVLFGIYIAHCTRFGRNVYAVGGSEQSALLMGLPVGRTKILVYAISGGCAALGGILWAMNSTSGNPAIGLGTELDAIACVVIGGTLLTGGVGKVVGTFAGVLVFGTIATMIRFQGLDSSFSRISLGVLLLAFIVLQMGVVKRAGKKN
jgi:simple sugar transport system permease protein